MSELFASPAADFDHPLDILDGCHQRIRRYCGTVERIGAHLASKGIDAEACEAARTVVRYFDRAGRDHHRDEEEDLFPALERLTSGTTRTAVDTLLALLRRDHGDLERRWDEMRALLRDLAEGREAPLDRVATAAFAATYERHIQLEERRLLPLARILLDAGEIARLGASMARRRGVSAPRHP